MAAPLIMSFFIGVAVKEAEIDPYQELLEKGITYFSTFFLGLTLGTLCEASTLLDPVVIKVLVLGILALTVSGVGGLLGGWVFYKINKGNFNPVIGIAGVSCVPTTAKLAQHAAEEENPFAMIIPIAMGANISGVITSAIAVSVSLIGRNKGNARDQINKVPSEQLQVGVDIAQLDFAALHTFRLGKTSKRRRKNASFRNKNLGSSP